MSFPVDSPGSTVSLLAETSDQKHPLGTRMATVDGRVFRYFHNGGVALECGVLCQTAVVATDHDHEMVVATAASIGDTVVEITNATTAIAANDYAEGYMFVNDGAGEGQTLMIKSHPAAASTTADVKFTLEDDYALTEALTTATSQVGLRKNKYKDVVISAQAAVTGIPLGVTPRAFTLDYYGWLQTWGPAATLLDGVLIIGLLVMPSGTTDGAVITYTSGGGDDVPVGRVLNIAATTDYALIDLCINP